MVASCRKLKAYSLSYNFKLVFIFLVFFLLITFNIHTDCSTCPQNYFCWTGEKDSDWSNTLNWREGKLPQATDSVCIPQSPNNPILNATNSTSIQNLLLQQGSTLTLKSGVNFIMVNGELTIENGNLIIGDEVTTGDLRVNRNFYLGTSATSNVTLYNSSSIMIYNDFEVYRGIIDVEGGNDRIPAKLIVMGHFSLGTIEKSELITYRFTQLTLLYGINVKANSRLTLNESTTLILGNNAYLNIEGTLKTRKVNSTPEIRTGNLGYDRFYFLVHGIFDVDGLIVRSMGTEGIHFFPESQITRFENVQFYNHPNSSVISSFITLDKNSLSQDWKGLYFDMISLGCNVRTTGFNSNIRVERWSSTLNGPGSGETYDCDQDANDDNIADNPPDGSVVTWISKIQDELGTDTEPTPEIIGFPTSAYDLKTYAFYSTYVIAKDVKGPDTEDRIYVLNAYGDKKNYYFDVPQSNGNIVCGVYWTTEGSGDLREHTLYFGTTTGKIYRLIDDDVNGKFILKTPFPIQTAATEITSCLTTDRVYLYFGALNPGGNPKLYAYDVTNYSLVSGYPLGVKTPIRTAMSFYYTIDYTYLWLGSDVNCKPHNVCPPDPGKGQIYRIFARGIGAPVVEKNDKPRYNIVAPVNKGFYRIYVGDIGGYVHGIDAFTPDFNVSAPGWPFCDNDPNRHPLGCPNTNYGIYGMIFITKYHIYFGDESGFLYKLDNDAKIADKFPVQLGEQSPIRSSPIVLGGKIYVGNVNGKIFVVSDTNGAILKQYDLGDGVVVGNPTYNSWTGQLIFSTNKGKIYFISK